MKDLITILKSVKLYFKFFSLIGFASLFFCSCINNEKIEIYRKTGEAQYQDLLKQMEAKYPNSKTDTVFIKEEK